jgi:hypothetical protein
MVLLILAEKVELENNMIFLEFLLTMLVVGGLEVAAVLAVIKLEDLAVEELAQVGQGPLLAGTLH